MDRVKLVDGTLREGEQTPGVYFTLQEKVEIARELDRIGVPVLDVGMPSISQEERAAISAVADLGLEASIGVSARLKKIEVDQSVECGVDEVFLICPVSPLHMKEKLCLDEEGVKALALDVVMYAESKGLLVNLVAEDAARGEVGFLCDLLSSAHAKGAGRAFICDTVGIMEPVMMRKLVMSVREDIPAEMALGVHCHNDLGLATANTLAAVQAGADYPSVTVNGLGERAGNAPLHELAVGLEKLFGLEHGVNILELYSVSRLVEKCSGVFIAPHAPIIGLNAFRHESGVHVDGIMKKVETYAGIQPGEVNRSPAFVLGKHAGTGNIRSLLRARGYEADEETLSHILDRVKGWKTAKEKEKILGMAKEMEDYYRDSLDFPQEVFWEIVESVMGGE